jgi:hypothetical protein
MAFALSLSPPGWGRFLSAITCKAAEHECHAMKAGIIIFILAIVIFLILTSCQPGFFQNVSLTL